MTKPHAAPDVPGSNRLLCAGPGRFARPRSRAATQKLGDMTQKRTIFRYFSRERAV